MKFGGEKGNFVEWLLMFLAFSVVIFAFLVPRVLKTSLLTYSPLVPTSGLVTPTASTSATVTAAKTPPPSYTSSGGTLVVGRKETTSSTVKTSSISLGYGNGPYNKDAAEEYITLKNEGPNSVNITGYRLQNNKNARAYPVGNAEVHYASDTAIIPQGAKIINPNGGTVMQDIVLKPGETATITTGGPGNLTPYQVVSFKENECTGYFAEKYRLPPGSTAMCVKPGKENGINELDYACQDYITFMKGCHTPRIVNDNQFGPAVDNTYGLSGACIIYIRNHFNYAGCLENHLADRNFEGDNWQIYLYRPWEMWSNRNEIISLYDGAGRLVAQTSY